MARKKRRFEQLQAAAAAPQEKKAYVDPFQQRVMPHIEAVGEKLEGKGRKVLYAVAAVIVIGLIVWVFVDRTRKANAEAQTALGKAIETSQARISETGPMAGSTEKTFKTEKERAEAAIAEFQAIVDNHGGAVGNKARFLIAVNRLTVDRPAGIQELEGLSSPDTEVGKLAMFALAQTRFADGRFQDAATLYEQLASMDDSVVAKDSINFALAGAYEKLGKQSQAVDLYFMIAMAATNAKDLDGKPIRMTETATSARDKVKELDPSRAAQLMGEPGTQQTTTGGGRVITL